jgi:hypothetical protein
MNIVSYLTEPLGRLKDIFSLSWPLIPLINTGMEQCSPYPLEQNELESMADAAA